MAERKTLSWYSSMARLSMPAVLSSNAFMWRSNSSVSAESRFSVISCPDCDCPDFRIWVFREARGALPETEWPVLSGEESVREDVLPETAARWPEMVSFAYSIVSSSTERMRTGAGNHFVCT